MDETALRTLLDSALDSEPPLGPIAQNSLRAGIKLRRRRRVRAAAGSVAAAAAIAIAIPAAIGHTPGPVTGHRAAASTVYFAYVPDAVEPGKLTIIPISTATSTAGKPIRLRGLFGAVALTPDGKTLYAARPEHGHPDQHRHRHGPGSRSASAAARNPFGIAITPDGKTAYAVGL